MQQHKRLEPYAELLDEEVELFAISRLAPQLRTEACEMYPSVDKLTTLTTNLLRSLDGRSKTSHNRRASAFTRSRNRSSFCNTRAHPQTFGVEVRPTMVSPNRSTATHVEHHRSTLEWSALVASRSA